MNAETPVKRYGRNTARGEASPSTCAAMVTAWLRQRRSIPAPDPQPEGSTDTRSRCAAGRVQRSVSTVACQGGSLLAPNGFVLTPQFHYRDRYMGQPRKLCSIKGYVVLDPVAWAENSRKRALLPTGEVCLNAKTKDKRSFTYEKHRHIQFPRRPAGQAGAA